MKSYIIASICFGALTFCVSEESLFRRQHNTVTGVSILGKWIGQCSYSWIRGTYNALRVYCACYSHLNQARHPNDVPPKTQIVHGIYSSRSTFLRMPGPENIVSTHRTWNITTAAVYALRYFMKGPIPHKHTNPINTMTYSSLLADRYCRIALLYINIFKSDLMSAIQTIIII
jgi:hypothetical protein